MRTASSPRDVLVTDLNPPSDRSKNIMLPFGPDEPRELRRLFPGLFISHNHAAWRHRGTRTDPVLAVERH
jgi:hypothetical protein